MTGWQVQVMEDRWEAQTEARWEALNAPDPAEDQMKEAAESIKTALSNIDNGLDWIADAIAKLDETPMADKLQSLLDDFESLANNLENLKNLYERGERE